MFASACGGSATDTTVATTAPAAAAGDPVTTTAPPSTTTLATTTTTETTTTTTATVSSTTMAVEDAELIDLESVIDGTRAGAGWLVEPGTYVSDILSRTIMLRTTESVMYVPSDGWLTFGEVDVVWEQLDIAIFSELVGVLPAGEVGAHPDHDPKIPEITEPLPDDLGEWLDVVPQLVVFDRGAGMVDGEPAMYWDVEVDATLGDTFPCQFRNCVATVVDAQGFFVMGDAARFRIWQLSGNGEGLYVWVQAVPSAWEATIDLSNELLEGLTISPTE